MVGDGTFCIGHTGEANLDRVRVKNLEWTFLGKAYRLVLETYENN